MLVLSVDCDGNHKALSQPPPPPRAPQTQGLPPLPAPSPAARESGAASAPRGARSPTHRAQRVCSGWRSLTLPHQTGPAETTLGPFLEGGAIGRARAVASPSQAVVSGFWSRVSAPPPSDAFAPSPSSPQLIVHRTCGRGTECDRKGTISSRLPGEWHLGVPGYPGKSTQAALPPSLNGTLTATKPPTDCWVSRQ